MQWTPEQEQAIESRGGTVLVSAAAGSGKTSVLVERVLRRLCDPARPCKIDELLIVTYTRAAAAHMREEIAKALEKKLRQEPGNLHLLRQKQSLPLAEICTIDSFCMRLVKEHGLLLGLPPELRVLDQSELLLLRAQAAEECLEAAYLADEPAFQRLGLLLEVGGDDRQLIKRVHQAADLALASPDPRAWLNGLPMAYQSSLPPRETPWGRLQLEEAAARLEYSMALCAKSLADLEGDLLLQKQYAPAFRADLALAEELLTLVRAGDWDALYYSNPKPVSFKPKPKECDETLVERCKARRETIKESLTGLPKLFCVSTAGHLEDMAAIAPVAEAFAALVLDYLDRYKDLKMQRQASEFNDNLHWAIALLTDEDGGRTDIARQLGKQYQEILVDEYQDANAAQERLFQAISRDGANLFLVGDVKQSIYRFRQANPALFMEKRRSFAPYDSTAYPACILLGKNFRSRPGVVDCVNIVFRQLMRADAMEIEYSREEELICGREFDPADAPDAELHLLRCSEEDIVEAEARYIAGWIAAEMERTGRRPGDFCILLRSDKKPGMAYAAALQRVGVEAYATESESLFQSREVQLLLSLLRVIDNPVQDIPLASVLLSPFVGFTPDDLAQLPKAQSLFQSLQESGVRSQETRAAAFLEQLKIWRRIAASNAPGDLLRHLLEDTALPEIAGAMRHPARRRANLHRLTEYAAAFSERPGASLSGFLRYIDRVEADQSLLAVNVISETADVVRVMSIHKSKGLEFPVCILARCGAQFNLRDLNSPLLLHDQLGLGLQRPDMAARVRLPTLPHMAMKTAGKCGALSEELRLLYVAMTRAKERLVLLCGMEEPEKSLCTLAGRLTNEARFPPALLWSAISFAHWLLPALSRQPNMIVFAEPPPVESLRLSAKESCLPPPDSCLLREVATRLAYRYPYLSLTRLPAKRAVSELTEQAQQERFAFSTRPDFTRQDSISAAQRGTAMHAFLQFADFRRAAAGLDQEIELLHQLGYLTKRDTQALEKVKLRQFFGSEFCARMLRAPALLREKKFTLRIPASELCEPQTQSDLFEIAITGGETIVVQGIVDCAFEENGRLILLDYKTDRVESLDTLRERYGGQLRLYRRAMRECFGMEVAEALVYSFWLGAGVRIEDAGRMD